MTAAAIDVDLGLDPNTFDFNSTAKAIGSRLNFYSLLSGQTMGIRLYWDYRDGARSRAYG